MVITDDHKQQASTLAQSIKDANPQHAEFFGHIEAAAKSLGDQAIEGAEDAMMVPLMAVLLLASAASGRPLFCG
jgi:hypothetical protein